MKNRIISTAVLVLTIMCMLASCNMEQIHPITKFYTDIISAGNFELKANVGEYSVTTQVDGNLTYTPVTLISPEIYTESVGNDVYTYTKGQDGKWHKEKRTITDSLNMNEEIIEAFADLFNPDNYEETEPNSYKQKEDVDFDVYDNVVITIDGNTCLLEMTISSGSYSLNVEFLISKVGEVKITLPQIN